MTGLKLDMFYSTGADKPMATSLLPGDKSEAKAEEPMESDAESRPLPPTSTDVPQNSPGSIMEKTLSFTSHTEFSRVRAYLSYLVLL